MATVELTEVYKRGERVLVPVNKVTDYLAQDGWTKDPVATPAPKAPPPPEPKGKGD